MRPRITLLAVAALTLGACVAPQEVRPPFVSERAVGSDLAGTIVFATQSGSGYALLRVRPAPDAEASELTAGKSPSYSRDGSKLAFAGGTSESAGIYVAAADGANGAKITTEPGFYDTPTWSPDGNQLAYAFTSNAEGSWDIVVSNADGSDRRVVVGAPSQDWHPDWSPDGTQIAFTSDRDGDNAIWTLDLSDGALRKIVDGEASDEQPAFSPDGSKIAFTSDRIFERWQVHMYDVSTREVTQLVRSDTMDRYPTFSPDGSLVLISVGYPAVYRADGSRFDGGADRWKLADDLSFRAAWTNRTV